MSELARLSKVYLDYQEANRFNGNPSSLYEPADYIMSLGGKRMRPLLVLMGYELFDEAIEKALPAALAVEVFHNFTLVHDDIMDAAPTRRGKPTVHTKYGDNTAILSGDVMLLYAIEHLRKVEPQHLGTVLGMFNKTAIEICEGQQFDMDFEQRSDVGLSEYIRMIELKTSVLLAAALHIGATLANASDEIKAHLYEFGRLLGISFQIQDDWLDTFGDPESVGKQPGGDIAQGKKTWLVLRTLELANERDRARLERVLRSRPRDPQKKIEQVKTIFEKYDIRHLASKAKEAYQAEGMAHLEAVPLPKEKKQALYEMAEMLLHRTL
jgi:geranylgeranyl diphosphate synthase type II